MKSPSVHGFGAKAIWLTLTAVFVLLSAIGQCFAKPNDIDFPGFWFFLVFSLLPCLASWILLGAARDSGKAFAVIFLVGAISAFAALWFAELYGVGFLVLEQSDRKIEGLFSNFFVFDFLFFPRALEIATVVLTGSAMIMRRDRTELCYQSGLP